MINIIVGFLGVMPETARYSQSKIKKSSLKTADKGLCVKIAISMPRDALASIEKARRRFNLSRSKFIVAAVNSWFAEAKQRSLVEKYIIGYESIPEDVKIAKALGAAQAESLKTESWQ
jgi:hypothetical protein